MVMGSGCVYIVAEHEPSASDYLYLKYPRAEEPHCHIHYIL